MDSYGKRLQVCIEFIESHLRDDLPLREVSHQANASLYHFHRLFRAFVGQSLAEYIRGRRLTYAARDLVDTQKSVIDIALEYQYSTPESFLRAFKALYGSTPREYRKNGLFKARHVKADLAYRRAPSEGGIPMQARIVERAASRLFGSLIHTRHGFCHEEVAAFWVAARKDRRIGELARKSGARSMYGACFGTCDGCGGSMETDSGRFAYIIGWEAASTDSPPPGMVEMSIPEGTYAVFALEGTEEERQEGINRIYRSWLPESSFELGDSPVLEKYDTAWAQGKGATMELWLPVRKARG